MGKGKAKQNGSGINLASEKEASVRGSLEGQTPRGHWIAAAALRETDGHPSDKAE